MKFSYPLVPVEEQQHKQQRTCAVILLRSQKTIILRETIFIILLDFYAVVVYNSILYSISLRSCGPNVYQKIYSEIHYIEQIQILKYNYTNFNTSQEYSMINFYIMHTNQRQRQLTGFMIKRINSKCILKRYASLVARL